MKKFYVVFTIFFCSAILSAQNIYTLNSNSYTVLGNVAMDAAGNLYIPDAGSQKILKIDAVTGVVTTVAGNGTNGYNGDGILATSAEIYNPNAIAVDAAGNIYIADYANQRIRKVTASTGLISTIAGTGVYGYNGDSLPGSATQIKESTGLAVDAAGNVYFTDLGNMRIRKIDAATGNVYNVAGNGIQGYNGDNIPALTAEFNDPYGIALDNAGNLLIADDDNLRVRKIEFTSGLISTVAGNGTGGYNGDAISPTAATIYHPRSVGADANGNFYVADMLNNRIRKVDNSGMISTVAGDGIMGLAAITAWQLRLKSHI